MPPADEVLSDGESIAFLREHYTSTAEHYERYWGPVLRPMGTRLVEAALTPDVRSVLDVGCGTGGLLPALRAAAPNARLVGADLSVGMLRLARRASPTTPLLITSAQRLAFRSSSFEGALMGFVLFHCPDPRGALVEMRRVLVPGGFVATATWGTDEIPGGAIWEDELGRLGADDPEPRLPVRNDGLMDTPERVASLLRAAGLDTSRAWTERFSHQWDPNDLFAKTAGGGATGRRVRALRPSLREELLARAKERFLGLGADELRFEPEVVFAIARRG